MGTSISQPSKRNPNWKPVLKCYENERIPIDRSIKEIWRASENEELPISHFLKSKTIFECYKMLEKSPTITDALLKYDKIVQNNKDHSIVNEFAKRSIPIAFQKSGKNADWVNNLFCEVTSYIVSRDASGFVGKNCRNKNISDLIQFKSEIRNSITTSLKNPKNLKSEKSWNAYIDKTVNQLKGA